MRVHERLATATRIDEIAAGLQAAAEARQAQLAALPPPSSPVAIAHRDSILRILEAIRHAQAQVADGTYGDCRRCGGRADLDDAVVRPWAPMCPACRAPATTTLAKGLPR